MQLSGMTILYLPVFLILRAQVPANVPGTVWFPSSHEKMVRSAAG